MEPKRRYIFFDSEVDGFPIRWGDKKAKRPRLIQLTWGTFDEMGQVIELKSYLMARKGGISDSTKKITGLTNNMLFLHNKDREEVIYEFLGDIERSTDVVSYNLNYEIGVLTNEIDPDLVEDSFIDIEKHCLMRAGVVQTKKDDNIRHESLNWQYRSIFGGFPQKKKTPFHEIKLMASCFFRY